MGLLPLIALNENGYKKIIDLSSRSYLENDKLSEPHLHINELLTDTEGVVLLSGTISQIDYPSNDISGNYVTIHFNSKPRFINVTNETLVDGSSYLLSNVSDIQNFIAIGNSANTYILEIDDNLSYARNGVSRDILKKLRNLGINHKMNLILSGLPGTGKSSLMYSIASHLDKDISTIDFNSNKLSDHSFICATNKIPEGSIFCLEDVDALYIERQKKEENRVSFSCILNFLDGVYSP